MPKKIMKSLTKPKGKRSLASSEVLLQQKEILFGLLLGNTSLQTYTGGKTWRIRFIQGDKNKKYLFHLYNVFIKYVKTAPKESWSTSGSKAPLPEAEPCSQLGKEESRWTFNTTVQIIGLKFSKFFYLRFGGKYKKVMPNKKTLSKYLTPIALAYWFMDNGFLKSNCLSYYLCTDCFELQDLKVLREVFKEKYDIDISFHKQRLSYRVYIPKRESKKFYNLIEICLYFNEI